MHSDEEPVVHKVLGETLVAQIRIHGKVSDLSDVFTTLRMTAGEYASGNPRDDEPNM
jgi:hypothetical protein